MYVKMYQLISRLVLCQQFFVPWFIELRQFTKPFKENSFEMIEGEQFQ